MAYRKITDEQIAVALVMLQVLGYPEQKGALSKAAEQNDLHPRTLKRHWDKRENPDMDKLVTQKKEPVIERLHTVLNLLLDNVDVERLEAADLRVLATAIGIIVDKIQILTGGPTENVNNRLLIEYVNDWRKESN